MLFYMDEDFLRFPNHEIELVDITPQVWQQRLNRTVGFFWLCDEIIVGDENIVRHVQKT
jgi:hypothetical protein